MSELKKGKNNIWYYPSLFLLSLFVIGGALEKINAFFNFVLIYDGILSLLSFFFVTLYFFYYKEFKKNVISISLTILTFTILFSSVINNSSTDRLLVALFSLLQAWAIAIAVINVKKDIVKIMTVYSFLLLIFSLFYCLLSLYLYSGGSQRLDGLSKQSNAVGVLSSLSILLSLSLFGKKKNVILTVLVNIFLVFSLFVFLFSLYKSDSRTSIISLIIAVFFFGILFSTCGKNRVLSLVVVVAIVLLVLTASFFLYSSSRTVNAESLDALSSSRISIWTETITNMNAEDFILGFGGNSEKMRLSLLKRGASESVVDYASNKHLMHNIFIQFLVEYGFVALFSFVSIFIFLLISFFKIKNVKEEDKRLLLFCFSILVFFLIHEVAESSIFFIGTMEQLFFVLSSAIIYSYRRIEE